MVPLARSLIVIAAASAVLVAAYAAAGFWLVPWLIRSQAEKFAEENYDRALAVGDVLPAGVKEVAMLLVSLAGLAIYPVLLFASGGVTVAEAKALLRRRRGDPAPTPSDLS